METKGSLAWLNKGNEITIPKMTLGAKEELLKFRSENPEPTEKEIDARISYLYGLKRVLSKWAIKAAYPDMNLNEISSKLDLTDLEEYDLFSGQVFKLNFSNSKGKDKAPTTEEGKK